MKTNLTQKQQEHMISTLKERFEKHRSRHKNLSWNPIEERLKKNLEKLYSLWKMEETGGEPDVIDYDILKDKYVFCDCSKESPIGRRNTCYDQEALASRKKLKPTNSALNMAKAMGIEILKEEQYRFLQTIEDFDTKTSSWIQTPSSIRNLGGALFCDKRYDTVFVYHNGAEAYYSSRGFRGVLFV